MDKIEEKNIKPKKDKFKWFVVIMIFILLFLLIQKIGQKPKNIFDSCYEKCTSLGFNVKEDGTCPNNSYKNEAGNWCKTSKGYCLNFCKK